MTISERLKSVETEDHVLLGLRRLILGFQANVEMTSLETAENRVTGCDVKFCKTTAEGIKMNSCVHPK